MPKIESSGSASPEFKGFKGLGRFDLVPKSGLDASQKLTQAQETILILVYAEQ
jgi:hypothetical protein